MIFKQLKQQLGSLTDLLAVLTDEQYAKKIAHLGSASIGSHTRHIIELLSCVTEGSVSGTVDYLNRKRNLALEQDRQLATQTIELLVSSLGNPDKTLNLIVQEGDAGGSPPVYTTYYRELVYNTEHAIHHQALIKVALIEMNLELVDANFGMAYSTLKFRTALAERN